ncbi:MAG: tetratricopeptide repeat protein [Methanomassiliicoccaceae archaeon]|nr:tetratricopeptide repeat protein [Methanomassiliicoccaceae archaeon]
MNTFVLKHGSLTLNIPRSIFVDGTAEFGGSAEGYFSMLTERYPWLSVNSIAVLKKNAKEEMRKIVEEEIRGPRKARMLSGIGEHTEAIEHLHRYLTEFPEDADAWYALGEILCGIGRNDEGYRAINRGRRISGTDR